jgi:hypothetical protein
MTGEPVPASLAAYWRALEPDVDDDAAAELFDRALDDDVVFESSRLGRPLCGRDLVVERLLQIRAATGDDEVERSAVQRSGDSLRWSWTVGGGATAIEGTDVATFAADGRIERLSVFDGATPPG